MTEKISPSLEGISETLLMTLYARARETQRPDALLKDQLAVSMVNQIEADFSRLRMQGHDEVAVILRMKKFDDFVRNFLARHPEGVVVHVGCGLDTRFERVDNGHVEWFDLDLPQVIELRKKLIAEANDRQHTLSGSVFEDGWLAAVEPYQSRPCLFIAEGVFPYFEEAQIKNLFLKLRDHFPGAEVVCDAHTPFVIWADNLQLALAGVNARLKWGLRHGKDVERWGEDIKLLDEWYYFDGSEPRMRPYRWMRYIPVLGKSTGIFHCQLGNRK